MNDDLATTAVLDNKGSNDGVLNVNTDTISVSGRINEALDFNGSEMITIPLVVPKPISISAWIYIDNYGSGTYTESYIARAGGAIYFNLDGGNGTLEFAMYYGGWNKLRSTFQLNTGQWYYVVATWDGTTDAGSQKLYIDGVLNNSNAAPGTTYYDPNATFTIGAQTTAIHQLDGKLDDVRIYDTAITADYIKLLYNAGAGTEDENVQHHNLVSHWLMNDDLATTAVLDTTGVNNGVLTNAGNTEDVSVAGKINKALDFDGSNDYVAMPAAAATAIHGLEEASISLWVKKDVLANYGLLQLSGFSDANGILYPYTNNNRVYLDVFKTARFGPINLDSSVLEWHHLVITTKPGAGGYKVYQNGNLCYSNTGEATVATNYGNFTIGLNSGNRYCDGKIDDVRIYNTALTPYYVKLLYNNGAGTEDENVQSNTLLLGCNF